MVGFTQSRKERRGDAKKIYLVSLRLSLRLCVKRSQNRDPVVESSTVTR